MKHTALAPLRLSSLLPSSTAVQRSVDRRRMAGKQSRAIAAGCLLIVLLLSAGQQQRVAAMSRFCRCYKQCYADCRRYSGVRPYPCNFGCIQDCFNGQPPPSPPTTATGCGSICLMGICDDAIVQTGPADVEACVDHCTKNLGAAAPAKIN